MNMGAALLKPLLAADGVKATGKVCIGTSAVDMVVAKAENLSGDALRRFGGKAEDSILPGYIGIETGQAAFGDIFAWYKRLLLWPVRQALSALPPEQGEAVAAGIYAGAPEAGAHMAARVIETFDPNEARREAYEAPYQAYLRLAAFQEHASSHQGCGTSAEKKDSL